ncbi:MAG TPA: hypothetical protein VMU04_00280 [Candidatus Acidoferrum sp.]|nr:hypothetical protein [Candidatus Acidoferrum sp.]
MSAAALPDAPLWAITSYFNPQRYHRRLQNYHVFRGRMIAPLITVELTFDGQFELRQGDADVLLQLQARDVMWQKERLLNLALNALPPACRNVAWVDCDVVFQRADWAQATSELLEQCVLAQPFQDVCELGRDAAPEDLDHPQNCFPGYSLAHGLATGAVDAGVLDQNMRLQGWNSGLAWAGRRDVLQAHGFYDACIMGSGNRAIVSAALGRFGYGCKYLQMNPRWAEHYLAWAKPLFQSVRGSVGGLEGTLVHLWHGDLKDRKYASRHEEFKRFEFDPGADIALDDHGAWRWNSAKPLMHQYVRDYFATRHEDG